MGTRRVLACQPGGRGEASLVVFAEESAPQTPEGVYVVATAAVVDPEPLRAISVSHIPSAAFVGAMQHGPETPGEAIVIGVAPLADAVALAFGQVEQVRPDAGFLLESEALRPIVSSLFEALDDAGIRSEDDVLVSGRGLTARLAALLVEAISGRPAQTVSPLSRSTGEDSSAGADILIDTTADSIWWSRAFPLVRDEGRIMLLLPPWPVVCPFDFYRDLHRRSLSLLARRVPSADGKPTSSENTTRVIEALRHAGAESGGWLVDVPVGPTGRVAVDLDAVPEGRGLLIRWSGKRDAAGGSAGVSPQHL